MSGSIVGIYPSVGVSMWTWCLTQGRGCYNVLFDVDSMAVWCSSFPCFGIACGAGKQIPGYLFDIGEFTTPVGNPDEHGLFPWKRVTI
jgi:hypothetical protein